MPMRESAAAQTTVDPAGEFPFAPGHYVLHLLASIASFRDAALDRLLRPLGLNVSRFRTLSVLVRCGDCTMSELANFSTLDRTTLTRIADQLVAAGLVARLGEPKDRRRVVLSLTKEGLATYRKGGGQVAVHNAKVRGDATEPELRQLARLLIAMLENTTANEATRASLIRYRRDAPADVDSEGRIKPLIMPDPKAEFPFAVGDYGLHLISAIALLRDTALDSRLKPLGLNTGRYRMLGALGRFGSSSMTELANFISTDRTTLTRIADHLVREGLAQRLGAPKDRRQVLLDITPPGREAHQRALAQLRDYNLSLLRDIPEPVQRASARTMKRLVGQLAPSPAVRDLLITYSRPAAR